MTQFLAALGGALVGATMVFVAELWKQALAGKTGARLIRVESNFNAVICAEASEGLYYGMLSDDVWRTHSVQVVPLLTEDALHDIAHTYLAVPLSKQYIEELQNRPDAANTQGARDGLESHARDFDKVRYWMFRIEKRGRFVLLVDLLLGRPRLPPGIDIDRGLAAMKSEAPKDRH